MSLISVPYCRFVLLINPSIAELRTVTFSVAVPSPAPVTTVVAYAHHTVYKLPIETMPDIPVTTPAAAITVTTQSLFPLIILIVSQVTYPAVPQNATVTVLTEVFVGTWNVLPVHKIAPPPATASSA